MFNKFLQLSSLSLMVLAGATYASDSKMTGTVKVDGSSTVYPITEAVAEEFAENAPRV